MEEFAKKGLREDIPAQIFDKNKDVEELKGIELICFTKVMGEYLKEKYDDRSIDIRDFFTPGAISKYDITQVVVEREKELAIFKNTFKINDKFFTTFITGEETSFLKDNNLFSNFAGIQRPRTPVTLANGDYYEKITINKEGVLDLKNRFLNTKEPILPTTVTFAVIIEDGKDQQYGFTPYEGNKNVGTFFVQPNFDSEHPKYTPFIVPDGYHRITALADAGREGKVPYGLFANIFILTKEEAKQYVVDAFKRNDIDDLQALKSITPTKNNTFIENVIKDSNVLNGNVADSFSKMKIMNKITYKEILSKSLRLTKIKLDNQILSAVNAQKIAKIIDVVIGYIEENYFDNNFENMRNSGLLGCNSFVGYIAIASRLMNNSDDYLLIGRIVDKIVSLKDSKEFKALGLNFKDCDIKKIYNYFDKIVEESINV